LQTRLFSNKQPGFCVIAENIPKPRMLRSVLITIIICGVFHTFTFSQEKEFYVVPYTIIGNDTVPNIRIGGVEIFQFRVFKNKHEANQNARLIRNVKIVYPYARLAGEKLKEYEIILSKVETEAERRRIMKNLEKEINEKYGEELKNLTITQGKILIKLIDRETGNTSFDLLKDLRGSFLAFFYQSFARVFGYNLKIEYDPEGEDRNIEIIVRMIENGVI